MIPARTEPSVLHSSLVGGEPKNLDRIRHFTGNYYRILGWIDLVSSVVALAIFYWTEYLTITFAFLLWFWLGNNLKEGSSAARAWAIAIPLLTGSLIVSALIFNGFKLKLAPWGIDNSNPLFLPLGVTYVCALAVPGFMLLRAGGRHAYPNKKEGEQVGDGDAEKAV